MPFLDHGATVAACRAFRAVIKGSQFLGPPAVWRLGALLPEAKSGLCGVVCDAKLFVIRSNANNIRVYDPQFDKWTLEINVLEFWYLRCEHVCTYKGRVVVILQSGHDVRAACSWLLVPR